MAVLVERLTASWRGISLPKRPDGGPIALVRDGDTITLDVDKRRLDVDADLIARRGELAIPEPRYKTGVFAKYVKLVASASEGAVTI